MMMRDSYIKKSQLGTDKKLHSTDVVDEYIQYVAMTKIATQFSSKFASIIGIVCVPLRESL